MIKLAPYQAADDLLEEGRALAYQRDEGQMFADIGFFMCWFALVEYNITALLAYSTRSIDLESFGILSRGMDARVKIERLRKSASRHGGIGPNLSARINAFEKGAIPLRNKIVHNGIAHNEDDGPRRYFISDLTNAPWEELNICPPKTTWKPLVVRSLDLYAWGTWLSFFSQDLSAVTDKAIQRTSLEIDNPKTRLPQEDRPANLRKGKIAKPDKPAQTE